MPSTDIILFDIPSTIDSPISPYVWRIRLFLNYKSLNFTTQYVPGTQLEATLKPLGILPTGVKPNGLPHYTAPAIIDRTDPANPITISDSIPIIDYLEKTYPSVGQSPAFPPGTRALQLQFIQSDMRRLIRFVPAMAINSHILSRVEVDRADFRQTMERVFGKPFEDIQKRGEEREAALVELENIFKTIGDAIDQNEGGGQFFTGERPACADFALAACMVFMRCVSRDDIFAKVCEWHGGRWERFFDAFKPWMALNNPNSGR